MPKTCTVCAHPDAQAIADALRGGAAYRDIASRFGLSPSALSRHKTNCLGGQLGAIEAFDQGEGARPIRSFNAYETLVELKDKALSIMAEAEAAKDKKERWILLPALREARACVTDMVNVYEAQKRIQAEAADAFEIEASGVFRFLRERYPAVLAELIETLKAHDA